MSDQQTKYEHLPYLDSIDQKLSRSSEVNLLKKPLRDAVNSARRNAESMQGIIDILNDTLKHIQTKKTVKKKKIPKKVEEYELP